MKSIGVTAIFAAVEAAPRRDNRPDKSSMYNSKYKKTKTSSKKVTKPKLVRVLFDSGSDGDLLFHKKGTPKYFPYSTRQVPKPWCTSNGTFFTEGKGNIAVKFYEYSSSKGLYLQPDIVEYDGTKLNKPVFDLIIGAKTMKELGIILDFKEQLITIDAIVLPMRDISQLSLPRKKDSISTA